MQQLQDKFLHLLPDSLLRQYTRMYDTPFLLLDTAQLAANYHYFCTMLPQVTAYYAMKACGEPAVLDTLHTLGASFDVSSVGELLRLQSLGVAPEKCFYTHPYKKHNDIAVAIAAGCRHFVFDCVNELNKFATYKHDVSLCLRIGFRNQSARLDLSSKFGCESKQAISLLEQAHRRGFEVSRLAFHVGSQSVAVDTFGVAIEYCAELLASKTANNYANIDTIDIGGGFPVDYVDTKVDTQHFFTYLADKLCVLPSDVRIIAEPGRFLVASAMTSVSSIIAKKMNHSVPCYYLDDGIYGAYSGVIYDQVAYPIDYLFYNSTASGGERRTASKLFGPSCDSNDVVAHAVPLPTLEVGDYIIGRNMGAYTIAHATGFSCMTMPKVVLLKESIASI